MVVLACGLCPLQVGEVTAGRQVGEATALNANVWQAVWMDAESAAGTGREWYRRKKTTLTIKHSSSQC